MRILAAVFLIPLVCRAELVQATFTLTPSSAQANTVNVSIDVPVLGDSDDKGEASGTVVASIEIDPESGEVSTLEFVSGDISISDVNLSNSGFFGSYSLKSSGLKGALDTPAPPAPVTSGQSPAELHQFIVNGGSLSGTAAGQNVSEDFTSSSISGNGHSGDFVIVGATPDVAASSPTLAVYDLALAFPTRLTEEVPIPDIPILGTIDVTVSVTGTIVASSQVALPIVPDNGYLAWTIANGIEGEPFAGDANNDGTPNGLAWALGYSAADRISPPAVLSDGSFTIVPGPDGVRNPVVVETSSTLSAGSFVAVSAANVSAGSNPISIGERAGVTVSGPGGPSRYYRLGTTEPVD